MSYLSGSVTRNSGEVLASWLSKLSLPHDVSQKTFNILHDLGVDEENDLLYLTISDLEKVERLMTPVAFNRFCLLFKESTGENAPVAASSGECVIGNSCAISAIPSDNATINFPIDPCCTDNETGIITEVYNELSGDSAFDESSPLVFWLRRESIINSAAESPVFLSLLHDYDVTTVEHLAFAEEELLEELREGLDDIFVRDVFDVAVARLQATLKDNVDSALESTPLATSPQTTHMLPIIASASSEYDALDQESTVDGGSAATNDRVSAFVSDTVLGFWLQDENIIDNTSKSEMFCEFLKVYNIQTLEELAYSAQADIADIGAALNDQILNERFKTAVDTLRKCLDEEQEAEVMGVASSTSATSSSTSFSHSFRPVNEFQQWLQDNGLSQLFGKYQELLSQYTIMDEFIASEDFQVVCDRLPVDFPRLERLFEGALEAYGRCDSSAEIALASTPTAHAPVAAVIDHEMYDAEALVLLTERNLSKTDLNQLLQDSENSVVRINGLINMLKSISATAKSRLLVSKTDHLARSKRILRLLRDRGGHDGSHKPVSFSVITQPGSYEFPNRRLVINRMYAPVVVDDNSVERRTVFLKKESKDREKEAIRTKRNNANGPAGQKVKEKDFCFATPAVPSKEPPPNKYNNSAKNPHPAVDVDKKCVADDVYHAKAKKMESRNTWICGLCKQVNDADKHPYQCQDCKSARANLKPKDNADHHADHHRGRVLFSGVRREPHKPPKNNIFKPPKAREGKPPKEDKKDKKKDGWFNKMYNALPSLPDLAYTTYNWSCPKCQQTNDMADLRCLCGVDIFGRIKIEKEMRHLMPKPKNYWVCDECCLCNKDAWKACKGCAYKREVFR